MKISKVALDQVGAFSGMFLDYLNAKETLKPFFGYPPKPESFSDIIQNRQFPEENRHTLVEVLNEQYGPLETCSAVENNILSLRDDKTYTVTTGHQLNIFTGPLYFIFKIATVINLAKRLKELHPDHHFVPVYWMASEDHDFEEISSFNLFGKNYKWETQQTGAVGRFAPQSLNEIIEQLPESVPMFEKAYLDSSTLAEAVRVYVNELFGEHGLIVVDADHHKLKAKFSGIMKQDIFEQKAKEIVERTNKQLDDLGYKNQAFAREINFFFLNGQRERIVEKEGNFEVLDGQNKFTREELEKSIDESPERFSPNVIMRPVYQEAILPNIAYIGGPAEVIYWLQLKGVFDHYGVSFPILMPRNFGMVINKGISKKIEKLGFSDSELFLEAHELKSTYIQRNSDNEHLLDDEKRDLGSVFQRIKEKAGSIDKSLEGFIGAETAKALKGLENVEKRLKKGQEQQNETAIKQIDNFKEKLFPNGGLQERHDNFLNFYLNNPEFIGTLLDNFDPFDYSFYQFWEE